jgi:ferredoxin
VQDCPTGIDIRKGLQYECIACAACIDACDQVMDKMDYPRGLIRYSTEHALEHKQYRLLRPRTLIYGGILVTLCVALVSAMALTQPVILDVIRDRNTLYRDVGSRGIQNNLLGFVFGPAKRGARPTFDEHEERVGVFRGQVVHALELRHAIECRHSGNFVVMEAVDCRGSFACTSDLAIEDHFRDAASVGQQERTERRHQIGL